MAGVPYRADVVGSMLRPAALKRARSQFEAGEMTASEFKRIEDRAVDQVIAVQEGAGVDVVTDGEMRRMVYFDAVFGDFDGIEPVSDPEISTTFHGDEGTISFEVPAAITQRLARRRFAAVEEFTYARGRARVPVKVTVPNPFAFATMWHSRASAGAYPSVQALCEHGAQLIRDEILELARLGCEYVQVDFPELTMLADDRSRAAHFEQMGLSTDWMLTEGMDLIEATVADIPGVTFGIHFCRGNYAGHWISSGGYGAMSPAFSRIPSYDTLLLEYDSDRAGDFEPLRAVPDDKVVVLGLISTKNATLESAEAVEQRIDEAAAIFPREQLAISTQCGFASEQVGNPITEDTQEAKLQLVVDIARRAWSPSA
jgi:5-methyltetrahydropteroyltriglutamate--homocysteine methyltransferase